MVLIDTGAPTPTSLRGNARPGASPEGNPVAAARTDPGTTVPVDSGAPTTTIANIKIPSVPAPHIIPESRTRKVELLIYFVSEVLRGTKTMYSEQEKMLYTLQTFSRKLRHYFQSHSIRVVTSFSLEMILCNREAMGRIAKWAIELFEFNLNFLSTHIIKSRALVEFKAEWMRVPEIQREELSTIVQDKHDPKDYWTVYFDGSLTLRGTGASVVSYSPTGDSGTPSIYSSRQPTTWPSTKASSSSCISQQG